MKKKSLRKNPNEISWDRVSSIFDYPSPPQVIWEKHFDYDQEGFEEFVRTPYEKMNPHKLYYCHENMAYMELQPEVFAYVFPACLMDWHKTLMEDEPCYHATVGFHEALDQGRVLERMLTDAQREQVFDFFRDSFAAKLETQRGLPTWDLIQKISRDEFLRVHESYAVFRRFNTLGKAFPDIKPFWESIWSMQSIGAAVTASRYCFDLVYEIGRKVVQGLSPEKQFDGNYGIEFIGESDSEFFRRGWLIENTLFVSEELSVDFLRSKLEQAAEVLRGESEESTVLRMLEELRLNPEVAAINIEMLLEHLDEMQ